MKVLHVIPSISLTQGGPSRAMLHMEQALAARGIEVTTATTNDDGGARTLAVKCNTPIAAAHATRWYFDRTTVFYKVSLGLACWLSQNIGGFDVVHAHALFSFAPVTAAMFARRARVPYVLRPLGVLERYGMSQRKMLKSISYPLVERGLLESAAAVHFTSRAEQSEAGALGVRCKGVVIPLGIDIGEAPIRKTSSGRVGLLFLARIDPKKKLEVLLRALSLVAAEHNDVVLRIAGTGDAAYVQSLKSLTAELGLAGRVEWLGHVEGVRKEAAFAEAAAFVLTSVSENFGIAVAEALAHGLPAIVSRGVAIQDEIGKAGAGIVVEQDVGSIASGIRRLLDERDRLAIMSHAARKLAEDDFSLERMGERLENLYAGLCRPTSASGARAA